MTDTPGRGDAVRPSADLLVQVQPLASRNEVPGWRGARLVVRLTAPPVDGAANRACRAFLAEALGVRRADVSLVSGEQSRGKRFRFQGITPEDLARRLETLIESRSTRA